MHTENSETLVLLDRDGTIVEERCYLSKPEELVLVPGAGAAIGKLRSLGFRVAVTTNQSGIGRGYFGWRQLEKVHARLVELLERENANLDGIFVCPHRADDGCACRKPNLGLAHQAAAEIGLSLDSAVVVGDKASDIEFGTNMGALRILVRTGYGARTERERETSPDFVVDDVTAAVEILTSDLSNDIGRRPRPTSPQVGRRPQPS